MNYSPTILKLINKLWKQNPELRLGQIMDSLRTKDEELFYMDDKELKKRLRELLREE